jgi:hypothetical protein
MPLGDQAPTLVVRSADDGQPETMPMTKTTDPLVVHVTVQIIPLRMPWLDKDPKEMGSRW